MTNLDSAYTNLPIPTPKSASSSKLKSWIRLMGLRLIGQVLKIKAKSNGNKLNKILLIRPDHLGDLLFLTPAIRYLRTLLPEAHLSLMIGPWGKTVVQDNPHLNEILVCEFPGFTRQAKPSLQQPYQLLQKHAKLLRSHHFDQAIILRFDHWWGAWLAAAAGIPRRFGYAIPEVSPFLTDSLPYKDQRHEVEQNWRLVHFAWSRGTLPIVDWWSEAEIMGPTEFFISHADKVWAKQWLQKENSNSADSENPLIIIHPGAGAPVKLWRTNAWVKLIQHLRTNYKAQVILSGGPTEVELCQQIATHLSPAPHSVAGQTSLSQLAALMAHANLVIGPDTGPLKLAAAVDTPTLQLYGPVDPIKFGPWGDPQTHKVITANLRCSPCNHLDYPIDEIPHHFCITGLSVQSVLQKVDGLLN